MEEKRKEILDNLIEDRIQVLKSNKVRLEEQLTSHTGDDQVIPEQFADQRKEKLAETIKEIKILENEKTQERDAED